jgi:hypothetical protein
LVNSLGVSAAWGDVTKTRISARALIRTISGRRHWDKRRAVSVMRRYSR